MAPFQPVALYGLEVPPGVLIPAAADFPATVSLSLESTISKAFMKGFGGDCRPGEHGAVVRLPSSSIEIAACG